MINNNNGNDDTASCKLTETDHLACQSDVTEEGAALVKRTSLSLVLPLTAPRRRVFCELKQVDFYWRQLWRQVQVMLLKRRDPFIFWQPKPVVLTMYACGKQICSSTLSQTKRLYRFIYVYTSRYGVYQYYVGHRPLPKVYLINRMFRVLTVLPSSCDQLSVFYFKMKRKRWKRT